MKNCGQLTFRRKLELRPETTSGIFVCGLPPSRHLCSHVSMRPILLISYNNLRMKLVPTSPSVKNCRTPAGVGRVRRLASGGRRRASLHKSGLWSCRRLGSRDRRSRGLAPAQATSEDRRQGRQSRPLHHFPQSQGRGIGAFPKGARSGTTRRSFPVTWERSLDGRVTPLLLRHGSCLR